MSAITENMPALHVFIPHTNLDLDFYLTIYIDYMNN